MLLIVKSKSTLLIHQLSKLTFDNALEDVNCLYHSILIKVIYKDLIYEQDKEKNLRVDKTLN